MINWFLVAKAVHILISVSIFIFSLFVYFHDRNKTENRLMLAVCSTFCICLLSTAIIEIFAHTSGSVPYLFPAIEFIAASLVHPFALHFVVLQAQQITKLRMAVIGAYMIGILFAISGIFHFQYKFINVADGVLIRDFSWVFHVYGIYAITNILLSVGISWKVYIQTESRRQKQQFKYFLTTFISTGLVTLFLGFILPIIFNIPESIYWVGVAGIGFVFVPYATIRYQYLDVKTAFHYSLFWVVALGILATPLMVVPLIATTILKSTWGVVMWGFLATLYMVLLQNTLLPILRSVLVRKRTHLSNVVANALQGIEEIDTIQALQKEVHLIANGTIHCHDLGIWVPAFPKNNGFEVSGECIPPIDISETNIKNAPKVITKNYFEELGIEVQLPSLFELNVISKLADEREVLGIVLFSEKKNYKPYDYEELKFISDLTDLILIQVKKIRRMQRFKSVTSEIVHELKNTTSGIDYSVAYLNSRDNLSDDAKEILSEIRHEMAKLNKFSQNHLNIEAIDKVESLQVSQLNLDQLIRDAAIPCQSKLIDKNIQIEYSLDKTTRIIGDEAYLKVVFLNIIDNAVKYLDKPKNIKVYSKETARSTLIFVQDFGPGMSRSRQNNLGKQWLDQEGRYMSSGFGFPLCQKIMEKHHGNLRISSQEGVGTIVEIEIPKRLIVGEEQVEFYPFRTENK